MTYMFANATAFNQNISRWDVRSVTNMDGMFNNTPVFNQNLGAWYITAPDLGILPTLAAGDDVTTFTAQNAVLRGQNPAYTLSGADSNFFSLAGGVLSINNAPTGRTSYNITIAATGSFGTGNQRALTFKANSRPEITDPGEIRIPENTQAVTTIITTDADANTTFSYTLSNHDAALFEITDAGELSFKDGYIPDYENPRNALGEIDENADQEYRVLVTVSDGISSDTQEISVTITPVSDESPTGIMLSSEAVPRTATANRRVSLLSVIDGDTDDTHTYTLVAGDGADDNNAFTIDGSSLRIKDTPASSKSSYSIRINVHDGAT